MRYSIVLLAALAACDWTSFDTLADSTWVHSQQTPDGIGSTNYAIAIAPVRGTTTNGGELAVLGNSEPTYSVLAFAPGGSTKLSGSSLRLATESFTSLSTQPVFTSDASGHVALAAATTAGAMPGIAVEYGSADAPQFTTVSVAAGNVNDPSSAVYAGNTLVVAAGMQLYQLDTSQTAPVAVSCDVVDATTTGPNAIAALASDGTTVYAWMQSGALLALPAALGATCVPTATVVTTTGFVPGAGAKILLAGGGSKYAVLAASSMDGSTSSVYVVDTTATGATGTATLTTSGLASAALGALGKTGATYLALGFPARTVGSTACGQAELYSFDATAGTLQPAPAELLNDAQPEKGQEFGRDLAVMPFNGSGILVVAAKGEIFAYYQTQQYPDDTRVH